MRVFDIIASLLGLIILLPLLLIIGLAVRLNSPGPILYPAQRVGRYGKLFVLYKFRSMYFRPEADGPRVTAAHDSRITTVGRILRKCKFDELPQLINVLRGDMAFVGPRPEDPKYIPYYTEAQKTVLDLTPGITSAATLAYRNEQDLLQGSDWEEQYVSEVLPKKLDIELAYSKKQNVLEDFKILMRTVLAVTFSR